MEVIAEGWRLGAQSVELEALWLQRRCSKQSAKQSLNSPRQSYALRLCPGGEGLAPEAVQMALAFIKRSFGMSRNGSMSGVQACIGLRTAIQILPCFCAPPVYETLLRKVEKDHLFPTLAGSLLPGSIQISSPCSFVVSRDISGGVSHSSHSHSEPLLFLQPMSKLSPDQAQKESYISLSAHVCLPRTPTPCRLQDLEP